MTTVKDYGVTEALIQDYVLRGKPEALSTQQLQAIAYDYLNKVMRNAQPYPKWPKHIADEMASIGVLYNKDTGLPKADSCMVQPWAMRANVAEESYEGLKAELKWYLTELVRLNPSLVKPKSVTVQELMND